jgi:DNA-binding transcriptional ArsR family regulator
MKQGERRQRILDAYRRDPSATLRELAQRTGLKSQATVRFHMMKLEQEGLVVRNTEVGKHVRPRRTPLRQAVSPQMLPAAEFSGKANRGEGAFKPKKARGDKELQARIDMVVAKAKAAGAGPGEDVIRTVRVPGGHFSGIKASRIG